MLHAIINRADLDELDTATLENNNAIGCAAGGLPLGSFGLFRSGMGIPSTPGAFLDAPKGKTFAPMDTLDPRNAMVYIYRPITRWGYEEVQAPVFFMDSSQLFGLKAGAYEWLELPAGTHDLCPPPAQCAVPEDGV